MIFKSWAPGVGLGFRVEHATAPELRTLPFLELHAENYIQRYGFYRRVVSDLLERDARLSIHGLTLGLMNRSRFETEYLRALRGFLREVRAPWYSDHLSVTESAGGFFHDLLPGAYTPEGLLHACDRVNELQDALELPILVENASTYGAPRGTDPLRELTFILELLERTNASMLLDVNNVFVNASNHGFDPAAYVDAIPAERVGLFHVAGHEIRADGLRIDTHGEDAEASVLDLLTRAIARTGPRSVLVERDTNVPSMPLLMSEIARVERAYVAGLSRHQVSTQPAVHHAP